MWSYRFTFKDGTEGEPFYCTSRDEARERARYWQQSFAADPNNRVVAARITGPDGQRG